MNELIQYIKKNVNGRKQKIGVMCGVFDKDNHAVYIGWSKVNMKAGDKFEAKKGLSIARERTKATSEKSIPTLPTSIKKPMSLFQTRCTKYFKEIPLGFTLV